MRARENWTNCWTKWIRKSIRGTCAICRDVKNHIQFLEMFPPTAFGSEAGRQGEVPVVGARSLSSVASLQRALRRPVVCANQHAISRFGAATRRTHCLVLDRHA